MSEQYPGESGPEPAPFAAESAVVRARLADLGAEAEELRGRARDLLRSATSRHIITEIDQRVHGDADTGRHALEPAAEFDPTPYDPSEDDDLSAELGTTETASPMHVDHPDAQAAFGAITREPGLSADDPWAPRTDGPSDRTEGGEAAAVAPGFHAVADDSRLPPVPVEAAPQPLADPEPDTVLASEAAAADPPVDRVDAEEAEGATIIEFAPRAVPEPLPADVERAFGAPEPSTPAETGGTLETTGSVEQARHGDGLAGIASSESTVLPPDWDGAGPDEEEDAFAKFFSAEVEPEPAQRWLLNE